MRPLLCMNISKAFGAPLKEQLDLLKEAGFDGFFMSYGYNEDEATVRTCIAHARNIGLYCQSIHAPFGHVCDLWHGSEEEAQAMLDTLLSCLRLCESESVPLMIVHPFIGFEKHAPTAQGLQYFGQLIAAAEKTGVRLAFENVEGEEYLDALMQHFAHSPAIGFCWDTGHMLCYNHGRDWLKDYGKLLLCTHLNDNLGVRDREGSITWLDDLHLLPFDGINDWAEIARQLKKHGYQGEFTFELTTASKPGRHDNDKYAAMPLAQYFAESYARACRVAACK